MHFDLNCGRVDLVKELNSNGSEYGYKITITPKSKNEDRTVLELSPDIMDVVVFLYEKLNGS
jgi:hypothetical protein